MSVGTIVCHTRTNLTFLPRVAWLKDTQDWENICKLVKFCWSFQILRWILFMVGLYICDLHPKTRTTYGLFVEPNQDLRTDFTIECSRDELRKCVAYQLHCSPVKTFKISCFSFRSLLRSCLFDVVSFLFRFTHSSWSFWFPPFEAVGTSWLFLVYISCFLSMFGCLRLGQCYFFAICSLFHILRRQHQKWNLNTVKLRALIILQKN